MQLIEIRRSKSETVLWGMGILKSLLRLRIKVHVCKHIPFWPCPSPSGVSSSSCVSLFPTQIACQRRHSGHLASVLSGTEGSFLASLVRNNLNTQSDVWIGLHDPTEVHLFLYNLLLPKMLWPLSFPPSSTPSCHPHPICQPRKYPRDPWNSGNNWGK